MTATIALAGKGGAGKTTVSALLVRALIRRGVRPILAIDADPSTNLHLALGLPAPATVGDIREDMLAESQRARLGVSLSRRDHLHREIRMALEEGPQVDLLAMGRPEGKGCYCAVNHLLREVVDGLGRQYACVVMDNEAGMEHISRRTTRDIDLLLVVSDPTVRGMHAAEAIAGMARQVDVQVRSAELLINRVNGGVPSAVEDLLPRVGLPLGGVIPADPGVAEMDGDGRPLIGLDRDSPASRALEDLAERWMKALSLRGGA